MRPIILAMLFLLQSFSALAADWRFAGDNKQGQEEVASFMDMDSITRTQNDVRVWVKTISIKSLVSLRETGLPKVTLDRIAKKIANGYAPPLMVFPVIKAKYRIPEHYTDTIIGIAIDEYLVANKRLSIVSRYYWSVDCTGKRLGMLSVTLFKDSGDIAESQTYKEATYQPIPAETQGEWIYLLACQNH